MLAIYGRIEEAIQRAEQALAIGADLGIRVAPAETARGIALSRLDPERAIAQLESAWALAKEHGNEAMEFSSATVLARVLVSNCELALAIETYRVLMERCIETRNTTWAHLTCQSLAASLAAVDQSEAATVVLGATEGFQRTLVGVRADWRHDAVEQLRAGMKPESFDRCFARGKAMSTDEFLTFAHDEVEQLAAELTAKSPRSNRGALFRRRTPMTPSSNSPSSCCARCGRASRIVPDC
jgi:hypothetical protein